MKAHICGTLKGRNKFLPKCFDNIERLGTLCFINHPGCPNV